MTPEERLRDVEAVQHRLLAKDEIWRLITRYARAIDEDLDAELHAIFTEDTVFETKPWTGRLLEGKEKTIKSFKDYIAKFDARKRFITNEQIDIVDSDAATGWANWCVFQSHNGDSYCGWGCYDWGFRRQAGDWKISKMIITVECMTTLEKGWGDLQNRISDYPKN